MAVRAISSLRLHEDGKLNVVNNTENTALERGQHVSDHTNLV